MGFIMRLAGRDKLMLKRPDLPTYWRNIDPTPPDERRYERQF